MIGLVGWLVYIMGIIIGTGADGLIGIEGIQEPLQDWKIICYQMAITKLEDNLW